MALCFVCISLYCFESPAPVHPATHYPAIPAMQTATTTIPPLMSLCPKPTLSLLNGLIQDLLGRFWARRRPHPQSQRLPIPPVISSATTGTQTLPLPTEPSLTSMTPCTAPSPSVTKSTSMLSGLWQSLAFQPAVSTAASLAAPRKSPADSRVDALDTKTTHIPERKVSSKTAAVQTTQAPVKAVSISSSTQTPKGRNLLVGATSLWAVSKRTHRSFYTQTMPLDNLPPLRLKGLKFKI